MKYYPPSWFCYAKFFRRFFKIINILFLFALVWLLIYFLTALERNAEIDSIDHDDYDVRESSNVLCLVLSQNSRHLTSSKAIAYTWGKRCDRFYFVTRLQNTSIDLLMLENFENTTDITSKTITKYTHDVLLDLVQHESFSLYKWFLRASDDSFVIVPNLRKLIEKLEQKESSKPIAYVGDVVEMYKNYKYTSTGSVMLFNRNALAQLFTVNMHDSHNRKCFQHMIYDHEFISCMNHVNIGTIHENLLLSQNLSLYRMDARLKDMCCSPNIVAFRSSNETDMYKFEFLYHRLDALSKIDK